MISTQLKTTHITNGFSIFTTHSISYVCSNLINSYENTTEAKFKHEQVSPTHAYIQKDWFAENVYIIESLNPFSSNLIFYTRLWVPERNVLQIIRQLLIFSLTSLFLLKQYLHSDQKEIENKFNAATFK